MWTTLIVGISTFVLLAAAVLAFRLLRLTRSPSVWLVIAAVAVLMAIRRLIVLYHIYADAELPRGLDLFGEIDGLLIAVLLVIAIQRYGPPSIKLIKSEENLRRLTQALQARVRELNCVFEMTELVTQHDHSLDRIIDGAAHLVRNAFQHHDVARVRITIDGRNYETSGFQQTPWCRRAGIIVRGELRGQIEVCYLEARPEADDGPFLAEEDKLLGAVAERLGRIVERKRAQEQLRQREAQLAQVARLNMMGELASGLAHELNQPLSAVVNYTRGSLRRLEQAEHVSDEIKDALESAATQAERAGEIVHRLRRFIRKRQPMCEHVDVNTLAMEVMGWVSPEARKRGIALSLDIGKDVPSIQGDRIQIEQVLLNLAWNAMEAIDEDQDELKEVRIRTTCASDGNVELQVVDTGRGLPSDDIDHIFDAFFTTKSDGMGIGLSISRSIIEAHGGRLWATERESGGTVFRFSLPVKTGGQRDVA